MMSFSEDTDFARSTPARIASYSVSLLNGEVYSYGLLYHFPGWGFKLHVDSSSRLARSVVHIKDPSASVTLVHIWLG